MENLKGKTLFVTGASRGIGYAIALRAARDGANVVVAAKTGEPHPKLPGTVYTAAAAIEKAGGKALPSLVDVRSEEQIQAAVDQAVATFGGIDILVNNASAIFLGGTLQTPMKRFDLMHQVNVRGTFACSQACLPQLKKADNPHILNISPPLNMSPRWFGPHVAYTIAKYGNEHVRARNGARVCPGWRGSQRPLAEDRDRDSCGAKFAGRRYSGKALPQTGDRGRCRLCDPDAR
jgi:citronellol/citronellal dehydrogenase